MAAPGPLQAEGSELRSSVSTLHDVGVAILAGLSQSLGLTGGSSFAQAHRRGEATTTALGVLKYLPYGTPDDDKDTAGVGHVAHTDAGSLSFVFTDVPGLQVAVPKPGSRDGDCTWAYIAPRAGHAIVNVGDSLQFLSGGRLRSSLHRVVPHPAALGRTKYTIVYLMRPETEAVFVDGDGKEWKSKDWYLKKFEVFGKGEVNGGDRAVVTGRKDYDGRWNPLIAVATI
jgi:isopenicillin N synthase-like dioxygenase